MIPDTIEKAKDLVELLEIDQNKRLTLQRYLTEIRTELLGYDAKVLEHMARQNVYAEILNNMVERILDKDY